MTENNKMYSLIKQVFIVLLSFSISLTKKIMFSNDEPCTDIPTIIDVNPVELKYHPFMVRLNKCTRSCNVLYPKICVSIRNKRHKF